MTLEQMYDELEKEIAEINRIITENDAWAANNIVKDTTTIPTFEMALSYRDIDSPTSLPGPVEKLIRSKQFKDWNEIYQELTILLYEKFTKETVDEKACRSALLKISTSAPFQKVDLFDDKEIVIYSPEEKGLAADIIKQLSGIPELQRPKLKIVRATHSPEYVQSYNETVQEFDNNGVSIQDIADILAGVGVAPNM